MQGYRALAEMVADHFCEPNQGDVRVYFELSLCVPGPESLWSHLIPSPLLTSVCQVRASRCYRGVEFSHASGLTTCLSPTVLVG